ncbi:hypothetical protein J7I93_15815 [Bacillus sp. ISL-47]|uniref:hypothetical protein n=1 Tax=Bacillus sp. ISL-47 TaxID=2819130 RepID=UPI001BEA76EB|nr:hypothetical protein [Bacillus sp. ISL-47]MBT2689657.1 hypothetical protein [Bacillus sp. ISL-47]MBT2709302.1 hypothetical protein [Pseudomonas sp. ISL-84]
MKTVAASQLNFKKRLSMIEQRSLEDTVKRWLNDPEGKRTDILPLQYTEDVFAKLESKKESQFTIYTNEYFRYVTLTEDNQIIIGVLDSNHSLLHRVLTLDHLLV